MASIRISLTFLCLCILPANLAAQISNGDTTLALCNLGSFRFGESAGSDCWGYTAPDGTNYAIMGVEDGVVFVNVTTMTVVDTVFGPGPCGYTWRDMATMGDYCYCVSECAGFNDGLMTIDLSFLPDSVSLLNTQSLNPPEWGFQQMWSHNLSLDTVAGFLYAEGWGGEGWTNTNVFVFDLADPANPTWVGGFGSLGSDIHDMYALNDTVYVAEGGNRSFSIWDLTNKFAPQLLTRWSPPNPGYAHNIWPSEDRRYVVTAEETPGRTVKIWNRENLANIQLTGEYLGPSGVAHNVQVLNDTIYISHYESGLRVVDMTDASNPVEVGAFDTHPNENAIFEGAWGAYPYAPDGLVYVSNLEGHLYILQKNLVVADDFLAVDSVGVSQCSSVHVDIHATNSQPVRIFVIPFSWNGPTDVTLDSLSTQGLRTEYFEEFASVSIDPFGKRAAYKLVSSNSGTSPDLEPGSGPIMSLYFTVPPGAADGTVPITITPVNGVVTSYSDYCGVVILPDILSGSVTVCSACGSCCDQPGDADDNNATNIADVTFLINRIFAGGLVPACCQEADANADGNVNIADVTHLIARIFAGGPAPVCGPAGMGC